MNTDSRLSETTASTQSSGLLRGHFKRIAERGFGDGQNSYAHCCASLNERLLIGTSRYILPMLKAWRSEEIKLDPFPVRPVPYCEMDLRGQIWSYDFEAKTWALAYRAPMVKGINGDNVPLANGFRNMLVFQGRNDPSPALYTVPTQNKRVPRRIMLRTYDGINFDELLQPVIEDEPILWRSFRGMASFKGKFFAAPSSGQVKSDAATVARTQAGTNERPVANIADGAFVRCTNDPASGQWRQSSLANMGDPANRGIFEMTVCHGYLYLGTINIREGFQLWRTDGEGPGPHRWEKVLDRGADRGPLNQIVLCMTSFQEDLYLATGIQNCGFDKANNIGPAGGEVIRCRVDGSWDLIVGQPRHTRDGFKIPASGLTSGFGTMMNGYLWRICAHEGALYVGTGKSAGLWPYLSPDRFPEFIRSTLDPATIQRLLKMRGGAELWKTTNGDDWSPVTLNGFDNYFNMGIRSLMSTPRGLMVGTANFYGPQVAIRYPSGWRYEENPRGGLEVWHGSHDHGDELSRPNETNGPEPYRELEGYSPCFESQDDEFTTVDLKPDTFSDRQLLLSQDELDPMIRLALDDEIAIGETCIDKEVNEYFGGTHHRNAGYWSQTEPGAAAQQLIREVVCCLDANQENKNRASWFLSIDRNAGCLAAELRNVQPKASIRSVVFDEMALGSVKQLDRKCKTRLSRDGRLRQPEKRYDAVLWIEGPVVNGHRKFAREVFASLKPGGQFVASDFLIGKPGSRETTAQLIDQLRDELFQAGFSDVSIEDVSSKTWVPFFEHSRNYVLNKFRIQQLDRGDRVEILESLPGATHPVAAYVFIQARR